MGARLSALTHSPKKQMHALRQKFLLFSPCLKTYAVNTTLELLHVDYEENFIIVNYEDKLTFSFSFNM